MAGFKLFPALVAGLTATAVMSAMMTMASKAGVTRMPPMPWGSMVAGDRRKAMAIGRCCTTWSWGPIAFGIGYALLFRGVLGKQWGGMTPVGLLMGHAVYGFVLAVVYTALL